MIDASLQSFLAHLPSGDLWVFGYGSLMWNPEFRYLRKRPAHIFGYHRALCIDSTAHRGTLQQPGLVVGLAPGGSCQGMAFRVAERDLHGVLHMLWQREMCDGTYLARLVALRLGGERARALAFLVNCAHPYYAGSLPAPEIARRVVSCKGERGSNLDYLLNTVAHLEALGVHDRRLFDVITAVRALGLVPVREAEAAPIADDGLEKI
jgi:cation transport protein ChaC